MSKCEKCGYEMTEEDVVADYHDPNNFYGHGQYEQRALVCDQCGHIEPL